MAKYRITGLPSKKFSNGGEKDKWGRSSDSEWYGFDPKSKQWTLGRPKKETIMKEVVVKPKPRWEDVIEKKDKWGRSESDKWYGFDPNPKGKTVYVDKHKDIYYPAKPRYTVKDKWGRPPGDEWYGFDPETKKWTKGKPGEKVYGSVIDQYITDPFNKLIGEPTLKDINEGPRIQRKYYDQWGKRVSGNGPWNNWGDGPVQMVYPEKYLIGPAGAYSALKGLPSRGLTAVSNINKLGLNNLIPNAMTRGMTVAEEAALRSRFAPVTVGNLLRAKTAYDTGTEYIPNLIKGKDPLKNSLDLASSAITFTPQLNALKSLKKGKDVYSLYKYGSKNAEDPTSVYNQYKFYSALAGLRRDGGNTTKFSDGGQNAKKDKWGRSKGSKWYGFDPDTKQWTLGLPAWKLNNIGGPQASPFGLTPTPFGLNPTAQWYNASNLPTEIPASVIAKQQKAIQDEILKNGMIQASQITRQGGLDKNLENFIKLKTLEESGISTNGAYEKEKEKIAQNKYNEVRAAQITNQPINLKKLTDEKNETDFVKTQEQEGWEAMNSLLNEMDNDAYIYYNKVKKVSDKERGDMSDRDLLRQDVLKAIRSGGDKVDNLLANIQKKSGDWQYNQVLKDYKNKPLVDLKSGSLLGIFDPKTKFGQFNRDFISDPLNVGEELIWDQDYMPNRNEILRDPSNPLYSYYMKRTGMDKSPLSQALQYINPFSSAAESSLALKKGNYGDAAYQFGEGLAKTVGLAAAGEVLPVLGQYGIPVLSESLPGLTYAQGLNALMVGHGITQLPKTARSIMNAVEKGDKESIRGAINQTATNAIDFLGVGELKNIWNVPEKSILYLSEDLTNSKEFAKKIEDLRASGAIDQFTIEDRLNLWKDAMIKTQQKYKDQGFLASPQDILAKPETAQYLKATFEEMKAERIAYLQSPEGRVAVQQMIDEFPEIATGKIIPDKGINKFGQTIDNTDNAVAKRMAERIEKDPEAFFNDFTHSTGDRIAHLQRQKKYYEATLQRDPTIFQRANVDPIREMEQIDAEINNLVEQQRLVWGTDKKDLATLIIDSEGNATNFFKDSGVATTDLSQTMRGSLSTPESEIYQIVKPHREQFTVDDYIKHLEEQSYIPSEKILEDAANLEELRRKGLEIKNQLATLPPTDPGYNNLKIQLERIEDTLIESSKMSLGNLKYNAFHAPHFNETIIGRSFLPQINNERPLVIAHEVAHGTPPTWKGFNKDASIWDWFRNYGNQGRLRQGQHPVDKVLSEIDLFDAPPEFVKYRAMKPWYKGNGTNPWPSTVEQIEMHQGMPSLDLFNQANLGDARDALEFANENWNKAANYFIQGSFGNEKVTFMAELKQAMLNAGYGERGKFTMKDLESFWKNYVQTSSETPAGWDLRILDIARPTARTKKFMLKGLNMPGYKKGGSIQLELSDDQIQDYIKKGYVVEEHTPVMANGGQIVSDMWEEVTGTPWQEAKTRGLTTGTYDENIALRNRLLAGEFGKLERTTPKNQYELAVEDLVKKGRTLDELVAMRVGTKEGLKKRFPEFFNEEVKKQIETKVEEEDDNYGLSSKINYKPYSDFGKVKSKSNKLSLNKFTVHSTDPSEFSSFDLDNNWKYKMYSDFGKPKINTVKNTLKEPEKKVVKPEIVNKPEFKQRWHNVIEKKDKWGRSESSRWYGFNPETKKWTLGLPKWKKDELKLNDEDKKIIKKIIPNKNKEHTINKINKSEHDFIQGLKSQIEEAKQIKTVNKELKKEETKLSGSTLPQGSMGYKNFDNLNYRKDSENIQVPYGDYKEYGTWDEVKQKTSDIIDWGKNRLDTLEKGIKRKLTTWGVVDDSDKEVKETLPLSANEYYNNPYGAQQILDVENGKGRQFKQQTMPLSAIRFGYRNRGDLNEINTDGLEITTFEGFSKNPQKVNDYSSVIAIDPEGKIHTGSWGELKDKTKDGWLFTKTFMNKVMSIDDVFLDGERSGNRGYWQPQITTLDPNGNKKIGALNVLTGGKGKEKYYGSIQGGRVLLVDPDTNEQYLVSGSLDHIKKEFKRIKGNKKYLNVYTLDNGTYSRGLSYKDKKLTKERLQAYDNENTSGGNGLYIISYDIPVNKYSQEVIKNMPNVRTKKDESYKKGHKLKNSAQMIVLHHTGNIDPTIGKEAIRKQYMTKGNNSSHVVIYQDGSREIFASPEQVTFHAGQSKWGTRENLNDFSIGVEFDGDTNYAPLTEEQIESFVEYYAPLAKKYNIKLKDIITHQMIRNRYLKAHKNESKTVKEKPDITQTEYQRILNYLKSNGYE